MGPHCCSKSSLQWKWHSLFNVVERLSGLDHSCLASTPTSLCISKTLWTSTPLPQSLLLIQLRDLHLSLPWQWVAWVCSIFQLSFCLNFEFPVWWAFWSMCDLVKEGLVFNQTCINIYLRFLLYVCFWECSSYSPCNTKMKVECRTSENLGDWGSADREGHFAYGPHSGSPGPTVCLCELSWASVIHSGRWISSEKWISETEP